MLVWTFPGNANVVGLFLRNFIELSLESWQVESGDLLVEDLGELVDLTLGVFVGVLVLPEINLSESLVGEGAGHDERWVTGGATQVEESTLGQHDNTVAIWELKSVDLRLDLGFLDSWVGLKTVHVNFVIEVTDVSDDGVVLHLSHVVLHDDALVSSGGDEDVGGANNGLELLDHVAFHGGLESANWINFGDDNSGTASLHGLSTTLTNVTETADDDFLTSDHDIGSSHDTIGKRVLAAIDVVELLFGDRVVDIDCSHEELTLGGHLVKSGNTGGGFLRNTNESLAHLSPFLGVSSLETISDDSENLLELGVAGALWIWELSSLGEVSLSLDTFVDEESSITTIIDENIWAVAIWPGKHSVGAIPVLLKGLTLPGENVGSLSLDDSSGGVVLGGEDVARSPSYLSTESLEGLDENSGLDGHVEGSRDLGAFENLLGAELRSDTHETWHLNLSKIELLSSKVSLLWELDFGFELVHVVCKK